MPDWRTYLRELSNLREQPEATAELSLRHALVTTLREVARHTAGDRLTIFAEASSVEGQPDLIVKAGPLVVGYGETKAPGTIRQLEAVLNTDQLRAYRRLPNLLLTDYLHFMLLRDGVEVTRATLLSRADLDGGRLARAIPQPVEELVRVWLTAEPARITSPERLATELARRARWLRDGIRAELRREVEAAGAQGANRPLGALLDFYRSNLMSDMDADKFADTYAQTVAYGLFVARFHSPGAAFDRARAMASIPASTAFLRNSVRFLLDPDTVPASVGWIVDDLVAILDATDDTLIARAAAVRGARDDAVVYFYEHFLDEYDADQRTDRGVYYTYPPLVSYTVRAVDDLLASMFEVDGLADQRVRVLDPAVGTGTFLLAAAEQAIARVRSREGEAMVPSLVTEHLVPHLYGFELLPAPYAIAHLKLGSYYELIGRPLRDGERIGVYLTNTLAEPIDPEGGFLPMIGALITEARSADVVKRETPILAIIGNPPYSVASHNREHIGDLMADFRSVHGEVIMERNTRPLDDDYLRFLRWSVWKLLEQPNAPGEGVIGLVTNSAYLSRALMRGVRRFLLDKFDDIYVLDLHGNQRDWFRDRVDEKVFPDVQVGIAITLLVRHDSPSRDTARVRYRGTRGRVADKYAFLNAAAVGDDRWTDVEPRAPRYSFLPRAYDADYDAWPTIADLMPVRSPGVISHRDALSVGFHADELLPKVREFADLRIPDNEVRERYGLTDTSDDRWRLRQRRDALQGIVDPSLVKPLHYRPFDMRVIYDQGDLVGDRRRALRGHLERVPGNLALVTARSATSEAPYAFVTRSPGTQALLSSRTYGAAVYVPLYTVPATGQDQLIPLREDERVPSPNIAPSWLELLREAYGTTWTPEAFAGYVYALLVSDSYRERYADDLEDEFPRIPLTRDVGLFGRLAALGSRLIRMHLLEQTDLELPLVHGEGDLLISGARHDRDASRLWLNESDFIEPVPGSVWDAKVGAYAPVRLWLANREGRRLARVEATHLRSMVAAIREALPLAESIEVEVARVLESDKFTVADLPAAPTRQPGAATTAA